MDRWQLRLQGELWRNRDFMRLWVGQTISLFGSEITLIALPLTAVLLFDATPAQMGLLLSAGLAPQLLIGLLAGVWVDRVHRRPILIVADLGRAVLLATVPILAAASLLRIEILYVISFAVGMLTVLFSIAYQAYLPWSVSEQHLLEANAKLQASGAVARIAGPGLGGALVQAVGGPFAVIVDAITFGASAASLGLMTRREPAPMPRPSGAQLAAEISEGLRFLFGQRILRATTAAAATLNVFFSVQQAVFMLYLVRERALAPSSIGAILAIGSVGGLIGAILAGRPSPFGRGPTLILATLVNGIAGLFVALSAVAGGIWAILLLVVAQAANGLSFPVYFVAQTSLRQALTPVYLRGRVTASFGVIAWGVMPIGSLLGGVIGASMGIHVALMVGGVGMLAAHLWVLFSSVAQVREIPERTGPESA